MAPDAALRRVSAVVPAYNEAPRIAAVLDVLVGYPGFVEVVVSDDGSTDGTAEVAAACGARVIRHGCRSGKGSAMQRGVEASTGEVIFFCDADIVGVNHAIIDEIVGPVRRGEVEMFVGMIDRSFYGTPPISRSIPLLGGTRALTRELWERTPPRFKRGFAIEIALNHHAARTARPPHRIFPGLSQTVKEKKYGFLRGTWWRWQMVVDFLAARWALRRADDRSRTPAG